MPGKFDRFVGAASFINSYLDQDQTERENLLREMESKVGIAARTADIQQRQATTRMAESLFPSQLEQAGLKTQQMQQQVQTGEMSVEDIIESRRNVSELYGVGLESLKALEAAGQSKVAGDLARKLYNMDYAGRQADVSRLEIEGKRRELETYLRVEGPEAVGEAAAAKPELETVQSRYQQKLLEIREREGLPDLLVNTERALAEIAPLAKRAEIVSHLATAKARLGALANSPAGKEQALREALARAGMNYDDMIIREALRKRGEWQDPETLYSNVFEAEKVRAQILSGELDQDAMSLAVTAFISEKNPALAKAIHGDTPDKTEITKGLTRFITVNKNLLMEQGIDYDKLASRERRYTTQDVERVMGAMMGHPDREGSFLGFSQEHSTDIKQYISNLINMRDPSQWERTHSALKAEKVKRWSQNDWMSALDVIRWIRWEMGKVAGSTPPKVRPPKAAHIGGDKRMSLPWPEPAGTGATDNTDQDLGSLLDEIDAELDLEALERELIGAPR